MKPIKLTHALIAALLIIVIPAGVAAAQEKPSADDIKDALGISLPPYFTVKNLKIRAQAVDTTPGQLMWVLTADPALGVVRGPDGTFMKSVFSIDMTTDDDLYEIAPAPCNAHLLAKTASKRESTTIIGTSASQQHGDRWVTKIIGFDHQPPPGQPKANFARDFVVDGTPQAEEAKTKACGDVKANIQQIRDNLLRNWKGYYVCGQGETGGELALTEMSDGANIRGEFKFFNLPGRHNVQPGSYAVSGHYDIASRSLTINPAGSIDMPSGYIALRFAFPSISDWTKLEGKVLNSPACSVIILSK